MTTVSKSGDRGISSGSASSSMASAASDLWEAVLHNLQAMHRSQAAPSTPSNKPQQKPSHPSQELKDLIGRLSQLVHELSNLPPMPFSSWNKLVTKQQVFKRLLKAAHVLICPSSSSQSSSLLMQHWVDLALSTCLQVLLVSLEADTTDSSNVVARLAASGPQLQQQVQQPTNQSLLLDIMSSMFQRLASLSAVLTAARTSSSGLNRLNLQTMFDATATPDAEVFESMRRHMQMLAQSSVALGLPSLFDQHDLPLLPGGPPASSLQASSIACVSAMLTAAEQAMRCAWVWATTDSSSSSSSSRSSGSSSTTGGPRPSSTPQLSGTPFNIDPGMLYFFAHRLAVIAWPYGMSSSSTVSDSRTARSDGPGTMQQHQHQQRCSNPHGDDIHLRQLVSMLVVSSAALRLQPPPHPADQLQGDTSQTTLPLQQPAEAEPGAQSDSLLETTEDESNHCELPGCLLQQQLTHSMLQHSWQQQQQQRSWQEHVPKAKQPGVMQQVQWKPTTAQICNGKAAADPAASDVVQQEPQWLLKLAEMTGSNSTAVKWCAEVLQEHYTFDLQQEAMQTLVVGYICFTSRMKGPPCTYLQHWSSRFLVCLLLDWPTHLPSTSPQLAEAFRLALKGAALAVDENLFVLKQLGHPASECWASAVHSDASLAEAGQALMGLYQQPGSFISQVDEWEISALRQQQQPVMAQLATALMGLLRNSTSRSASSNSSSSSTGGGSGGDRDSSSSRQPAAGPMTGSTADGRHNKKDAAELDGGIALQETSLLAAQLEVPEELLVLTAMQELLRVVVAFHTFDRVAIPLSTPAHKPVACRLLGGTRYVMSVCEILETVLRQTQPSLMHVSADTMFWLEWQPNPRPGPVLQAAIAAGPGSRVHKQTISVMCSLIKLCSKQLTTDPQVPGSCLQPPGAVRPPAAMQAVNALHFNVNTSLWVAGALVRLMFELGGAGGLKGHSGCSGSKASDRRSSSYSSISSGGSSHGSSGGGSSHGNGSSGGSSSSGVGSRVTAFLSCAQVFGRCCFHWAEVLPHTLQVTFRAVLAASTGQEQHSGAMVLHPAVLFTMRMLSVMHETVEGVADCCHACAANDSCRAALSAAGCDARELLSLLEEVDPAIEATVVAVGSCADFDGNARELAAVLGNAREKLVITLRAFGTGVSKIAVRSLCNNHACCSFEGLSESAAVVGPGSKCKGCGVARYCSRSCSKQHWHWHKQTCRALQRQSPSV